MLSTLQIIVYTLVAAAIFLGLSYTRFGKVVNTVVFTLLVLIMLFGANAVMAATGKRGR